MIRVKNSLLQGGKEPLRIAYRKKLSVSKATCLESVFKTVQIILWDTSVTKSSRKVFINVNLVRVLPLRTNLASFFNNKIKKKKKNSGRSMCKMFYIFSFYPVFYSQWTLNIFQLMMLHTELLHFELQAMR